MLPISSELLGQTIHGLTEPGTEPESRRRFHSGRLPSAPGLCDLCDKAFLLLAVHFSTVSNGEIASVYLIDLL